MKTCLSLLIVIFLLCRGLTAMAEPILQPNDRVAICGDLVTGSVPSCSIYIEDYLLMSQVIAGLDVAQFSWSATDPSVLLARLGSDLLPYKPTVVLLGFNAGDVNTRARAQTGLVEALKKAGVRTIVIGSPNCVDSFAYQNDPVKAAAQNKTLGALAGIDKEVAAREGVIYADVYGATMAAMTRVKKQNGESYAFSNLNGDQPGAGCDLIMAYAYLKALNCDGHIGTITVDYAAGTAEGTSGQKIVSFKDNTMMVESTRQPFHYPAFASGQPDPDPIVSDSPFNEELNRYMLIVKNLPSARTKIYWGGDENCDYSSDELARGVNLTATMLNRVFAGPSEGVSGGVYDQQQQESVSGLALVQGKPDPQADAKREAALRSARNRVVPVQTKIVIQPLVTVEKQPPGPIPVIVDTDMASDCDDVGAVALLNSFMDQGEARLIACVTNAGNGNSGAVVQAINTWYGHPSIPIGSYHGEAGPATKMTSVLLPAPPDGYHGEGRKDGSHYTVQVHQRFCPNFPTDDKLPAGVDVYRKALASAADGSVVMVSIGLMENVQDLIQSQPDSVSNLNGIDLVKKKVRELVIMANTVPQDNYLLGKWPTKILWTTDVGTYISTGQSLISTPENNPVRFAYGLFGDNPQQHNALKDGRSSWDLTAAWLAVRGPEDLWDVIPGPPPFITGAARTQSNQSTVTIRMPYADAAKIIGEELARPPVDCPIPRSTDINAIRITDRHRTYGGGADTWFPVWAGDGTGYSPFMDGMGACGMVWTGAGENAKRTIPAQARLGFAIIGGNDPMNLVLKKTSLIEEAGDEKAGNVARYASTILPYKGVLYYGSSYRFIRYFHYLRPFAGFDVSTDGGTNWTKRSGNLFPEADYPDIKIGEPHFVDFGPELKNSPDGKAYLVAFGADAALAATRPKQTLAPIPPLENPDWCWADCVYLLRITPSPETINDASKYEYYAGNDVNGKPVWTRDFLKIKPVVEWADNMGQVAVTYVPPLKKYIMCVTEGRNYGGPFNTYFLESSELTGPWRIVTYWSAFGKQAYQVHIPSHFIGTTVKNGSLTAWICYAANFNSSQVDPPDSKYAMCLRQITINVPAEAAEKSSQSR